MATEHQYFIIDIPKGFSDADRETIGEEVIDFIRERTKDGKSWRNREFAGYSDSYAHSLNFKIAGKSKKDVDLTLSGDMLGALTLLDHRDGKLKIGYEKGSQENAIADGNIRGTYGKDKPVGPKRDFLGITKTDLSRILDHFTPEEAAAAEAARQVMSKSKGTLSTDIEEED
jgi:hypothetical protein